jgi:hypothetical protein
MEAWVRPDPSKDIFRRYPAIDMVRYLPRDTDAAKAWRTMMMIQVCWRLCCHIDDIRGMSHFVHLGLRDNGFCDNDTELGRKFYAFREELAHTYRRLRKQLDKLGYEMPPQDWWGSCREAYVGENGPQEGSGYVYQKPGRLVDAEFLLDEVDGISTDILYRKSEEWAH